MAKNSDSVSLKEYFEKLRQADKEAVALALTAAEKAVAVAEANAEKWRDNANEWRAAMTDREKNFMRKEEFEAYRKATEMALNVAASRLDMNQGKGAGLHQGWVLLVGLIGIVGGILTIASKF